MYGEPEECGDSCGIERPEYKVVIKAPSYPELVDTLIEQVHDSHTRMAGM